MKVLDMACPDFAHFQFHLLEKLRQETAWSVYEDLHYRFFFKTLKIIWGVTKSENILLTGCMRS